MILHHLLLKGTWPFIWTNLKAPPSRMLFSSLVEIGAEDLEKKITMWKVYDADDRQMTTFGEKSSHKPSTQASFNTGKTTLFKNSLKTRPTYYRAYRIYQSKICAFFGRRKFFNTCGTVAPRSFIRIFSDLQLMCHKHSTKIIFLNEFLSIQL